MGRKTTTEDGRERANAGELARAALRRNLDALGKHLALAATSADGDPEHVHRLRVTARRGMTLVRIAGDLLRRRDRRRLRRVYRAVRRAAGDARDLDVLLLEHGDALGAGVAGGAAGAESEGGGAELARTRARRAAAQEPIRAAYERFVQEGGFVPGERRLLQRVARRGRDVPVGPWAAARLRRVFERFVDATPHRLRDPSALHRYRIRAKGLRDALEALAPVLPGALAGELASTAAGLQRRLGEVRDHAALAGRLQWWADGAADPADRARYRALAASEARASADALDALEAWWRPAGEARFLAEVARLVVRAATER